MTALLRPLWAVLSFVISVPLWLILVFVLCSGLWFWLDKTSAVRDAVNELVAGAELEAAEAEANALRAIIDAQEDRARRLTNANKLFQSQLAETQNKAKTADEKIRDLGSRPVDSNCSVTPDITSWMREQQDGGRVEEDSGGGAGQ